MHLNGSGGNGNTVMRTPSAHRELTKRETDILNFVRSRYALTSKEVTVPEICAHLLLPPDVVYRDVAYLISIKRLRFADSGASKLAVTAGGEEEEED